MLVALALLGAGASRAIRVLLAVLVAGSVFIVPLSGPLRITATAVVCFIMGSLIADFTGAKRPPLWPVCVCVPVIQLLTQSVVS